MPYPSLPDRRMPYDIDGSVVVMGDLTSGFSLYPTGGDLADWQGVSWAQAGPVPGAITNSAVCFFFPEEREVTGFYVIKGTGNFETVTNIQGSNDTTNGIDGTWETATLGGGVPAFVNYFSWRDGIKPISFTGGKKVVRINLNNMEGRQVRILHLYGEKVAGQTPDDLLFLDGSAGFAEFSAPLDFGDRSLGTTVIRSFKVKNDSPTLTANDINLQCNDTDFSISDSVSGPWVVTYNIASLAAGASSAQLYVKNTTPAPGNPLKPRFARVTAIVGSYT